MERTGTIIFFDLTKGYGFIRQTNTQGDEDIFFHQSDLLGLAVRKGDFVEYIIGENKRGRIAKKVTVLKPTRI